ncbi:MAG: 5-(carboxyamino)imidazole ribonucleotide synthase [Planctomycetes bacterium]|nr:5-(carboxyamino)imidazole ribonucleotide synthase [Planctomycetota bacterium]
MTVPILPGAEIGVLGGGQLGRMFTFAAARLGYRVAVYAPDDDTPAGQVACREIRAPYEDLDSVERFARSVSVVTFEFENVPGATADAAARHAPVRPAGRVLGTTQDRIREKAALRRLGLPLPRFAAIESSADLGAAAMHVPGPSVLKTAGWGYDGKGQRRLGSGAELRGAWAAMGSPRAVLEELVPFRSEVSVVGARGLDGSLAIYEPTMNTHVDHVLDVSVFPAPIARRTRDAAIEVARAVLEGLDVVGVLCVEMFERNDGELLVNELAPRPHNSGHLTIDAHACSQFEQQVRSVCGLPLGSTESLAPAAAMANLLGDVWSSGEPNWPAALADPGLRLHLYGKNEARPGRKMGHMTSLGSDAGAAERAVRAARAALLAGKEGPWTRR